MRFSPDAPTPRHAQSPADPDSAYPSRVAVASLNLPVPGAVRRLANDLRPQLAAFDSVRDDHTLAVKRLDGDAWRADPARVRERLRRVLDRTRPFSVRVTGIDAFTEPTAGTGPVVYLAVESPGLHRLHGRLCREFDPVEGIEGENYTPHVTLARGGRVDDAERLAAEPIDDVEWTASEATIWDARYREAVDWFTLRG